MVLSATDLLRELSERDVAVDVVDGKLRCRHVGQLPPDLRSRISEYKDALVFVLNNDGPTLDETSEIREATEAVATARYHDETVWWSDPSRRPLPANTDARDRGIHAAFAPFVYLPPRSCIAPIACSRIGPCDRRAAGQPCQIMHGATP